MPTDERILAVYLVGSYATGEADEFSDVDVHCVVTDESLSWFEVNWQEPMATIAGPIVYADSLPGLVGGLGITPDWLHVDLFFHGLKGLWTATSTTACGSSSIAWRSSPTATNPAPAAPPVRRTGPSARLSGCSSISSETW